MPQRISSAEFTRLAALYSYGILDTPADLAFDRILRDLATSLRVPVAQLVFADAQRFWAKSTIGPVAQDSLRGGMLADLVVTDRPTLLVSDADAGDHAPSELPPCELPLRSYAAIRIASQDDDTIGLIHVADVRPRAFTAGEAAAIEAAVHNVSVLLESQRRAWQDGETGALTRPAFEDNVRRMVSATCSGRQRISLVRFDLSTFRASLEAMGMGLGRIVLRRMADIGLHQVRRRDCFGRIANDAFAVLLTDTGETGARILADRLSQHLSQGWSGTVPSIGTVAVRTASVRPVPGDAAAEILLAAALGESDTPAQVARSA